MSYDPKGERVETVTCPNCGVQRPAAIGVCPNCLTSTTPAGARLARGFVFVGIGIAAIVGVGYLISQRVDHAPPPAVTTAPKDTSAAADSLVADSIAYQSEMARTPTTAAPTVASNPAPPPATTVTPPKPLPAASAAPATTVTAAPTKIVDPQMVPPKPSLPPKVAVPDTGVWEYAVALTWVRVRSAPTRDSDVLRMVDSAQRVRLGPPQSGWRPVHVGVDRGWVDPRLFSVVPANKP